LFGTDLARMSKFVIFSAVQCAEKLEEFARRTVNFQKPFKEVKKVGQLRWVSDGEYKKTCKQKFSCFSKAAAVSDENGGVVGFDVVTAADSQQHRLSNAVVSHH